MIRRFLLVIGILLCELGCGFASIVGITAVTDDYEKSIKMLVVAIMFLIAAFGLYRERYGEWPIQWRR